MSDTIQRVDAPADSEAESLKKELAAAREERERIQKQRDERDEARRLRDQLEQEKIGLKDDRAILDAEEKHGPIGSKIAVVRTPLGVIIVKRPNAQLYRKFQDQGSAKHQHLDQLVRPCIVYPTLVDYESITNELPGISIDVANEVVGLARQRKEDVSGK